MARRGRKEFDKTENIYFITTTVQGFIKIFSLGDKYFQILLDSLKYELRITKADLIAYVFMQNHIHFILHMPKDESISDFMREFKKFTSKKVKESLESERKTNSLDKLKEISGTGRYKLWKDRFDCQIIYTDDTLKTKVNYVHFNPVKAGLVNDMCDWKYSSARNYFKDDYSLINVSKEFLL